MESFLRYLFSVLTALLLGAPAYAAVMGQPTPGAIGFQEPATRIMERAAAFHDFVFIIITIVTIFVLALLIWIILRYNKKANPVPKKFSHNTAIEIIWTVVPVIILIVIAGPSFSNLFYQENEPDLVAIAESGDMDDPNVFVEAAAKGWVTVKTQGNQWNWTYIYTDELDDQGYPIEFVSNPLQRGVSSDVPPTSPALRNLEVDYPMVVPANRYIRYQTAASDVIHSWTVPAFGVKTDAVPGRLNEGWFLVEKPGVYYGQCSELCGKDHAFMPIEVRVVPEALYAEWLTTMKNGDFDGAAQLVQNVTGETRLAQAD